MSVDKENKFDEMLGRALQRHTELVPADFTEKILGRIKEAEERRILARVVLEERLVLAGCILLGIITIAVTMLFPGIAAGLTELVTAFIDKIPSTIAAIHLDWQFYAIFAGVFGFAVYNLVDLLVGNGQY